MLSGLNRLNYNLYFDAAFTQIRGDGTGGSQTGGASLTVSSASRTATATSTLYGRIPASQNAVPGTYLDTITVTITY
jgi:spore coat protein U-like protein